MVVIIALLAAILFPVFARARERARSTSCQNNLRQIGLALQLYADDYDGAFPPVDGDLTPLVPRYLQEPDIFSCPSGMIAYVMVPGEEMTYPAEPLSRPAPIGPSGEIGTSYFYVGGRTVRSKGELGLLVDGTPDVHNDRGNVLLVNGRVFSIRPDQWPKYGLEELEEPAEPEGGAPGLPAPRNAPVTPPGPPGGDAP